MSSLLKIGELAKQTGVSIRTLHYYDEIDLLSPSHRTEVGHRLYGDRDLIRLQQILSLRQLGFSLHEIRECLKNPNFSLPRTIDLHLARLRKQMELSRSLFNQLSAIAKELPATDSVAVENLIEAMETISMTEQHLTPEQQTTLTSRFQEQEHQWQEMLTLARMAQSKDPYVCSTLARALANYWQQNMKSLIGGDMKIYESLIKLYHQEGAESATWGTMDTATFEYILKAVAFASLTDEIQPLERNLTPKAIQVMHLALDEVGKLHMGVLGTEAILLGLLAEDTSTAARLLKAAGVTFDVAQHHTLQLLGSPPTAVDVPDEPSLAPRAARVFELAGERAEQLQQSHITPEHLLLGILEEDEETPTQYVGVAIRILKEGCGIDPAHWKQQLREATAQ